jgi:hypothetical protein
MTARATPTFLRVGMSFILQVLFAERLRSDAICAVTECAARSTFRDSVDRCLWRLVRLRFGSETGEIHLPRFGFFRADGFSSFAG